jgi:4-oxalocrotonate tautomerase
MPLVRIDISKEASAELIKIISDAVYDAMTEIAKVPVNDKFQIVNRHAAGELIFPAEGYLGVNYTTGIIFLQITWVAGRATAVKKAFYKKVADDISAKGKVRKEDIFISLVDSGREDWSFGKGEMQYAPAQ